MIRTLPKPCRHASAVLLALAVAGCQSPAAAPAAAPAVTTAVTPDTAPWVADLGDGRYRNPVLHADYSDPDAIRVGDTYYMTSSSFNAVPGLPLLTSPDMVNWTLVGHALPRLLPLERYASTRHGEGVWAPSLRHHDGKFWIFYPDPDVGIFVTTATSFSGPWSQPRLVLAGKGIIDPTPLWDDDGKAYLLHAWARSRAGFNNVLTLRRMAPDASALLDDKGQIVIDGNKLPNYRTLEGPKFYKHDGYYYVFAPAGGVEEGWQSVFRARSIGGPYEARIVMDQGETAINGPHQGAWVRAQDGKDWFLHFQDRKAYGRVVHLNPMRWADGWPVIGEDNARTAASGAGQPVLTHAKPVAGGRFAAPPSSDEFDAPQLGLQWQWNANPDPRWASLSARRGMLRLHTQPAPAFADYVRGAPSLLTQKLPAPSFVVDTHVRFNDAREGERAGLIVNAMQYGWIGLRQTGGVMQLVSGACTPARERCREATTVLLSPAPAALHLRMTMAEGARARFWYSLDNVNFVAAGQPLEISKGRWVGAQVGLFSIGKQPATTTSSLDVDYFRVTAK